MTVSIKSYDRTPLRMSCLSSLCSMKMQIFQLDPVGSAFTSRHSGWSPRESSLTCSIWPVFTCVRITLSPITTCAGGVAGGVAQEEGLYFKARIHTFVYSGSFKFPLSSFDWMTSKLSLPTIIQFLYLSAACFQLGLPLESTAKVHSGTTDEVNYKCLASQHLYGRADTKRSTM